MREWISQLDTAHVLLILLGIMLLAATLLSQRGKASDQKTKLSINLGCLFSVFLALVIIILTGTIILGQIYTRFTQEKLIATVICSPANPDSADFKLHITYETGEQKGETQVLNIRGEQWAIGGHVIKWKNWLNILGLDSMYKITRIEGRYPDSNGNDNRHASVYIVANEKGRGIWKFLYRNAHRLPLVSSVYGNLIYTYPSFNRKVNVYVNASGFFPRIADKSSPLEQSTNRDRPLR